LPSYPRRHAPMGGARTRQPSAGSARFGAAAQESDHLLDAGDRRGSDIAPDRQCRYVRAAARTEDVRRPDQTRRVGRGARSGSLHVLGTTRRLQPRRSQLHSETLNVKTIHRLVFAIFALASATTPNAAALKVLCSNGI